MATRISNKDLLTDAVPAPGAFDRGAGAIHSLPIEDVDSAATDFEIIYVKGASCRVGDTTFEKGCPIRTHDRDLADRCRTTAGFIVRPLP